ncbi:hypothetical protein IWQ56_002076, partial [Coemansia nantahalensis]
GEADVHVTAAGDGALRRRDGESLYVRRWRYAQTLAGRAMHEARVAAGEIEEAEEGEEREDGEDDGAAGPGAVATAEDDAFEDAEDEWPDPDACAPAAEDAQRRVCVATAATALRWWPQMQMRPIGASKDVRWVAFVPPAPVPSDDNGDGDDNDWCRASAAVAEWYLADVDSAYQAAHLGTHRPLGLQRPLDGVFTRQTRDTMPVPPHRPHQPWSARLRYEAERLGRCTAHAWYTSSQQQYKAAAEAAATPAVVLYMLVPHSTAGLAPWAALGEAAVVATRAFEAALRSLIARMSRGAGGHGVSWPAVVVHPLPLDQLADCHRGRRRPGMAAPSPHETAMAVYNCTPKALVRPPAPAPLAAAPKAALAPSNGGPGHVAEFLAAAGSTAGSAVGRTSGGDGGRLERLSGYAVYGGGWAAAAVSSFAHRAFVVAAPCAFPVPGSAVAPAAVAASSWARRSVNVAAAADCARPSPAPRPPSAYPPPAELAPESPLQPLPLSGPAAPAAAELDEACVSFAWRSDDPARAAAGSTGGRHPAPRADRSQYAQLVSHPLRSCDVVATLHCVYTVVAAGAAPWVAVCWCDERGEYVEHDVFAAAAGTGGGLSGAAAGRIWRGCLRYQAVAGGAVRVVLAEWQGMALAQARAWRAHAAAWHARSPAAPIHLLLASAGVGPADGLRLARPSADPPAAAAAQWSLVLHPQPPLAFAAAGRAARLDEPLDACARAVCPTGYLVLQDRRTASAPAVPCVCLQLLDHAALGPPCSPAAPKTHALTVRAILRQYHQLACLAHAELDATGRATQGPAGCE